MTKKKNGKTKIDRSSGDYWRDRRIEEENKTKNQKGKAK